MRNILKECFLKKQLESRVIDRKRKRYDCEVKYSALYLSNKVE